MISPPAEAVILPSSLAGQTTAHEHTVQWASPPRRASESTSDGVVAWFGPLSFRSSTLCEVELVSGLTPDYRLTQMLVLCTSRL